MAASYGISKAAASVLWAATLPDDGPSTPHMITKGRARNLPETMRCRPRGHRLLADRLRCAAGPGQDAWRAAPAPVKA